MGGPSSGNGYLNIRELSSKTGFSVTQLRRLARQGRIPCFQPGGKGGKLLFPPDAIEQCLTDAPDPDSDAARKDTEPLSGRLPAWMKP
jgi:hypothetical protein